VGLWDPHNVTEDADLGVRLARFGYTTGVVDSTTWEEAPSRLGAWLPQRTRWFKGWMQTYLVHMRDPLLLLRQLGWRGFVAFQLLIGGSVLAALVHPVFALLLVSDAALGSLLVPADSFAQWADKSLIFVTLMSGYIASGVLALVGMRRRGLLSSAWVLLFIPIYWLLLSAAAWRAAWKLFTAPHQWEKTAHGVVRRRNMN
jgi:cellulose synthase/poly-beta-1,6-N-acetylglucosamine synthase-like glycosyltransferase